MKKEEPIEVQAVREHIAKVAKAREAHALVVGKKDTSAEELAKLTGNRAAVRDRLRSREKEIALTGGKLPDEPFPEDAEMARLDRHVRIGEERVRDWERKVSESQAGIRALICELEESWVALGAATGDRLLQEFRQAALALVDAQHAYAALANYFNRSWAPAAWKVWDVRLAIVDPVSRELILNPMFAMRPDKWTPGAQALRKDVDGLRAEVDAAKSDDARNVAVH
jgi:hypothetical protein